LLAVALGIVGLFVGLWIAASYGPDVEQLKDGTAAAHGFNFAKWIAGAELLAEGGAAFGGYLASLFTGD
jgi:hypothetical protein